MRRGAGEPDGVCLYSSLSAAWHSTAVPRLCHGCAPRDCIPINCQFSPWSEWQQPTCEGLCTRSRVVQARICKP